MGTFQIIAVLLTLAAVFAYLNHRFVRLPTTIGLMLISGTFSLALVAGDRAGLDLAATAQRIVARIDFNETLMQGMLSYLLFAGSLHINLESLSRRKWTIGTLATVGVVLSTFMVGGMMFVVMHWLGIEVSLTYCLIFGALISPTDPIAVLGLLKKAGAPESLKIKIAGESLFNDGVGVVVFMVFFETVSSGQPLSVSRVTTLLLWEAGGGVALGLVLGWAAFRMLKSIDNYQVEILITLALTTGGYGLASALHTSGPLAIVAAGLFIGNHGRLFAMSDTTVSHLDTFWELVDEILNAVLFVLIGLEILVVTLKGGYLLAGVVAIPVVLLARLVSVGVPVVLLKFRRQFSPHVVKLLTWGGLRGGISVALVLSLPPGSGRDVLLTVTYCVVVFSIAVQGLTLPLLLKKTHPAAPPSPAGD